MRRRRAGHGDHPGATELTPLTTAERRGLAAISTAGGRILVVAADQRNSMWATMADGAADPTELAAAKADLVRHLGNAAPGVLLDPEVALPAVVDDGTLARDTALVVGMDASGHETVDGHRRTRFVPGVTARRVRELGGNAAKMLFYVRSDRPDPELGDRIRDLVRDCADQQLLLVVELLTHPVDGESDDEHRAALPEHVAGGTRLAVSCGAKVLKLPYPGSAAGCAAVTAAAAGAPWAVLSAGVDHATFLGQVRTAMAHGASGAVAGRSLWKDSLSLSAVARRERLTQRALPRLRELAAVVDGTTRAR